MKEIQLDILLDKKNIFIGKINYDITNELLIINNKN